MRTREGWLERWGWRALAAAGSLSRLRPRALVVEVKRRVLERAGVGGDEIREYLDRLGYESTGQVLPVANEVYRPRG